MRIISVTVLVCFVAAPTVMTADSDNPVVVADPCDKPCITEISTAPWTPAPSRMTPKVVYGDDDRIDVYAETDPQRLAWAASTCALINVSRLTQHADGTWSVTPAAYLRWGLPACEDEPFGDQPTTAFCTGFMVGRDLIATAGHCYDTGSLAGVRFVFGFWMQDDTTPRLTFLASEVYQGIEVVSYEPSGSWDHSIVRVDRPIVAPGAQAFTLRQEGVIQPGEFVGVIGHPSGLPMKIAFGNTYVRSSDQPGYFVANLDTYGGNSGSPVINATTGILEGILVRGETDFLRDYTNNCFYSNACPSDGCRGEDVTKATVFAANIPGDEGHSGVLQTDRMYYRCEDDILVTVVDPDLIGESDITVDVETSSGDFETLTLFVDGGATDTFTNAITLQYGDPATESGVLEVMHADVITAYYYDAMDQSGEPATRSVAVEVDCDTPEMISASIGHISGTQLQLFITTNVPCYLTLYYGGACSDLAYTVTSPLNTEHVVIVNGLEPYTTYYLAALLEGQAGATAWEDNDGNCFEVSTYGEQNYFTENFEAFNVPDIAYHQLTFTPADTADYYTACMRLTAALPASSGGDQMLLGDDDFIEIPFTHGDGIPFYGTVYGSMFVGSNGYITFGSGDDTYQPSYSLHFQLPRISAFMCDLNPEERGGVYFARTSDRYVVTFEDVPIFDAVGDYPSENTHTFQVELFFDGVIRITWLELFAVNAVSGLSAGLGVPADLFFTNLDGLTDCAYEGVCHSADINNDWRIDVGELLRAIQLYNAGEYHCNAESEDGYDVGDGNRDCPPHDSDYSPVDWRFNISELLRLIQLYNAGGYRPAAASEDGFSPLP